MLIVITSNYSTDIFSVKYIFFQSGKKNNGNSRVYKIQLREYQIQLRELKTLATRKSFLVISCLIPVYYAPSDKSPFKRKDVAPLGKHQRWVWI